jgi:hypothetical protein
MTFPLPGSERRTWPGCSSLRGENPQTGSQFGSPIQIFRAKGSDDEPDSDENSLPEWQHPDG